MRNFNEWLGGFRSSIADYQYYVDFNKVYTNVDAIKIELNILNSLIGSSDIEEDYRFDKAWLTACREKLKSNGTIWISGTYHNIFSIARCLSELGFRILNCVTWEKTSPPPNLFWNLVRKERKKY